MTHSQEIINDQIAIKDVLPRNLDLIIEIEHKIFTDPWPYGAFINEFFKGCLFWGAYNKNELVGYLVANRDKYGYHLTNLAVDIPFRRQGVGRLMLRKLIKRAQMKHIGLIYLEVRSSNSTAILLYESEGFVIIGCKTNYYINNEDALIFSKSIDKHITEALTNPN